MFLFTYWETPKGTSKPGYIGVCEETITKHCSKHFRVRHLNASTLEKWLPDINRNLQGVRYNTNPAHTITAKSNYIRVALLKKYGGIWVDADTLVIRDFAEIWEALNSLKKDFVCCPQVAYGNRYIGNCILGSQKEGKVVTGLIDILDKLIARKSNFKWGDLGHKILTPLVNKYASKCYKLKERQVYPIRIQDAGIFLKEEKQMMSLIDDDTICFMLYNSIFPKKTKRMPRTQLLTGKTVLSKAFRHSLGIHIL